MLRFLLLNVLIVFAHARIPCELHDVTTLIRFTEDFQYHFEVHSRSDAIGLPLHPSSEPQYNEPHAAFWCEFNGTELCSGWRSTSFVHSNMSFADPYFGDGGLRLSETSGEIETTEFATRPTKAEICVALRYYLDENVTVRIVLQPVVDNVRDQPGFPTQELKGTGKVVTRQFSFPKPGYLQGTTKIKLKSRFRISEGTETFVVRSVKECSGEDLNVVQINQDTYGDRDRQMYPGWHAPRNTKSGIRPPFFGYGVKCPDNLTEKDFLDLGGRAEDFDILSGSAEDIQCENAGIKVNGYCQCFPGYMGPVCEEACPPNRFGKDCGGVCNPLGYPGCKGILIAGPGMLAECPRGYYGDQCEKECPSSRHGPSCKMNCGHCVTGVCDPFSGLCKSPCARGYFGRRCDKRLASAELLAVTATGFEYIEGYVNITLKVEEWDSYPFAEIKYSESGGKERGFLIEVDSNATKFYIKGLQPGRTYNLNPVLIHESGSYFKDEQLRVTADTECNACSEASNIGTVPGKTQLTVKWTVTDSCEYSCLRKGFELEMSSPDLDEIVKVIVGPDDTTKILKMNIPGEGAVRLRPMYLTKQGSWSNFSHFQHNYGFLKVVNTTDRAVDFVWKKNDGPKDDVIECEGVLLHCPNARHITRSNVHLISGEIFTVTNLHPFTQSKCTLQNEKLADSVTTLPSLPSNAPRPHDGKATNVGFYSSTVYWLDAECMDINGLRKGYLAELYHNGTLVKPAEETGRTDDYNFHYFGDLKKGTYYEARIYTVNHIGYNTNKYYTVSFKTKLYWNEP